MEPTQRVLFRDDSDNDRRGHVAVHLDGDFVLTEVTQGAFGKPHFRLVDITTSSSDGSGTTQISTTPHNFSTGMFSWFPLYFPLQQPVPVPAGAAVQAQIWRKTDHKKVWYEWSIQVTRSNPTAAAGGTELLYASPLHNPGGRSSHVAL